MAVVNLQNFILRHWRNILVVLFVVFSLLLIGLISTVVWSYYNGVLTPHHDSTLIKSNEDFLNEQWGPVGFLPSTDFVNSDSSELNFDELENTNSVNSALMHPGNFLSADEIRPAERVDVVHQGEIREFLKNNNEPFEQEVENAYYDLSAQQKPQPTKDIKPKPPKPSADASTDNPPMMLYKVTKSVKTGAVCLDGSPPAYYHRPGIGPNERSWIIHFNGGAWCFDINACIERSHSSLGSTDKLPKSPPIIQGINSPNPTTNPDFYDWNLVWVVYCDGASFTGNRDRPVITKSGQTIYMRGKRVLNAIVNDLYYNLGFRFAESVILTGSSAGSMAAIFQADYIASKFPPSVPVRVLSDAGFFINTAPIGGKSLHIAFKKIFDMQNSTSGLNQDCVKDNEKEPFKCFMPEVATRYVKTPIFALNSNYDIWALIYFLGIDCKFPATGEKVQRRKRNMLTYDFQFSPSKVGNLPKSKRDVSGFEMKPFFRDYISKAHDQVRKVISKISAENQPHKTKIFQTIYNRTSTSDKREHISNQTRPLTFNTTAISSRLKTNSSLIHPSIVVITTNSSGIQNTTDSDHHVDLLSSEHIKKESIEKPTSFDDNLKSISKLVPTTLQKIQQISDETHSTISHRMEVGVKKSNTPKPSKEKKQKTKHSTTDQKVKTSNSTKHSLVVQKRTKKHVLKQRRSTSIAREYINILRSDPPECTGGEMNKAMLYRDAIIKSTTSSLNAESGRFLVSCIDHSMSLFDETWTGIKIGDKSIQQAFGDWFFERVSRDKSNLIDCKYPCNLSCP